MAGANFALANLRFGQFKKKGEEMETYKIVEGFGESARTIECFYCVGCREVMPVGYHSGVEHEGQYDLCSWCENEKMKK